MITVPPRYHLGLDIGSTAVKVAVTEAATGAPVWCDYQRHESRPADRLLDMLTRLERDVDLGPGNCLAYATGGGAAALAPLVGARLVQEVAAVACLAERRFPAARAVVELGGQDAKIVRFEAHAGGLRKIVSMNDKCAGGTGAVIDKISAKLRIPAEAVGALAYDGRTVYPIAGKCGVFAETDINSHQKRGVPAEELMASLFDAIVLQNLAVLARGSTLQPAVLLVGGPHAFIRGLREAWRAHLGRLWQERGLASHDADDLDRLVFAPPQAEYFGALGAIELGRGDEGAAPAYLGAARLAPSVMASVAATRPQGVPGVARSGLSLEAFTAAYDHPPWTPPAFPSGEAVTGFVGLDAGSTSTKAVLLSPAGDVLAKAYQLSRGNPIEDGIEMFRALRHAVESRGASVDVRGLVTTGYAKDVLKDVFCADAALVETVAHAESALQLYGSPDVIVDVGGQDIKLIVLSGGRVKDFRLNTQCSAGNGYFLQAIASNFGYPVEAFAGAAFGAAEMPEFGYGCVVFLQSEIANMQRRGWRPHEVLAGLAAVLPKNVFLYVAKAPNVARLGTRFVLQGGTQRNLAAVKAQVDFIRESFRGQDHQPDIILHRHAGEAGAIGAALEAIRLWREGRETTFIGLDAAERVAFRTTCDETTRCHYCKNECLRTFIDVWSAPGKAPGAGGATADAPAGADVRRLVVANCERGAAEDADRMRVVKAAIDRIKAATPNLIAFAAREVFRPARPEVVSDPAPARAWSPAARARKRRVARRAGFRVGMPRVFNMYGYAPFFSGYLESLGVQPRNIVYSDFTSTDLYRAGASRGSIDPCFPSKVALAHVHQLTHVTHAKRPLHCLFFPMIDAVPVRSAAAVGSFTCPTVALTPQTVRAALTKEGDVFDTLGVPYLTPLVNLADRPLLLRQLFETWSPWLGLTWAEHARAVDAGFAALAACERRIKQEARKVLDDLERDDRIGIVLLGRAYHHDPGLNHGIPEELQKLGYPVFSQSTLPDDEDLLDRLFGDDIRRGLIRDAFDISDVWKNSFAASSNLKIWAAKFTARHPNLVAVELSNFKCGHDAPIYATIEAIVEQSGTPYFAFKDIDENRPAGAIKLRLETIDYALGRYRDEFVRRRSRERRIARHLARYERRLRRAALVSWAGASPVIGQVPSGRGAAAPSTGTR
jgi:activator of 2-hydroxyglutaryl-CoA dehydratase/predicted nucleotide-binding protein (sugar kinase/HSP70/actin superfamily)